MNRELIEALDVLEKEKGISKEILLEAVENSLIQAYKNHFGKADNVKVTIDRETGDFKIFAEKTVVDEVEDAVMEISLDAAHELNKKYKVGDVVNIEVKSKEFGRIATTNAKNIITQRIREEERNALYDASIAMRGEVVTGIVQRYNRQGLVINLGKIEGYLNETEQVKGEKLKINDRVKVYVNEIRMGSRGPQVMVSRTHPELVKRLFEMEVAEIKDGIVEILGIAREPGSRSKICVRSNHRKVDPVGACVGVNGSRVGAIVTELRGEKIDIINWNENSAQFIENALSPAKVVSVVANDEDKTAKVVVPDYQLSLAIGKEGQNARLAAKLTSYKIDIKSESQAREAVEKETSEVVEEEE